MSIVESVKCPIDGHSCYRFSCIEQIESNRGGDCELVIDKLADAAVALIFINNRLIGNNKEYSRHYNISNDLIQVSRDLELNGFELGNKVTQACREKLEKKKINIYN